jgi:hypothetical protein
MHIDGLVLFYKSLLGSLPTLQTYYWVLVLRYLTQASIFIIALSCLWPVVSFFAAAQLQFLLLSSHDTHLCMHVSRFPSSNKVIDH